MSESNNKFSQSCVMADIHTDAVLHLVLLADKTGKMLDMLF